MYTYIITNHINSVFYIGVTNNLERRISEHKTGTFNNSFSKRYRLYKMIWFQEFENPLEAIAAEKKIKGWKRSKKVELIKEFNSEYKDLTLR